MRINISSSPQDAGLVFFIYSSCYDIWIPQICFLPWFPPLWLCCSTEMCPSFERPVDSAHLSQTLTLLKPCSLQFLLWLTEDLLALLTYTADPVASSQEIMVKNCSWTEGGALVPASGTLRTWLQLLESQPAHDTSLSSVFIAHRAALVDAQGLPWGEECGLQFHMQARSLDLLSVVGFLVEFHMKRDYHCFMKVRRSLFWYICCSKMSYFYIFPSWRWTDWNP